MTEQHEPLWKPEEKSGTPDGLVFPAPHAAPIMMSHVVSRNETYSRQQYHGLQMF